MNVAAILDKTFLVLEMLKPIFCSAVLIGIHFTRPYLAHLLDTPIIYETLLNAFPILYNNYTNPVSENLLRTDERVVNDIDDKRCKSILSQECFHESASSCAWV